jgi:hypothetical protein
LCRLAANLHQLLPAKNFQLHNKGASGQTDLNSGSSLDKILSETKPHIVLFDFSVNDAQTYETALDEDRTCEEESCQDVLKGTEMLLLKAQRYSTHPAVLFIEPVLNKPCFELKVGKGGPQPHTSPFVAQQVHERVAEFHLIPMISLNSLFFTPEFTIEEERYEIHGSTKARDMLMEIECVRDSYAQGACRPFLRLWLFR